MLLCLALAGKLAVAEPLPYETQKDCFSFAQAYLSIDAYQYALKTPYFLAGEEQQESRTLRGAGVTIGGLHYWGAFDFFVSFPFATSSNSTHSNQTYSPGIETGFKYYPFPIQNKKIRPYFDTVFAVPRLSVAREGRGNKIHLSC